VLKVNRSGVLQRPREVTVGRPAHNSTPLHAINVETHSWFQYHTSEKGAVPDNTDRASSADRTTEQPR